MGFNKVPMCVMSILLICYLLLPTNVIADDQWKGDNFDSYPVGALVSPPDGWQSLNNKMWSIATGGVTGNALFFAPNVRDLFVHPNDDQDYKISVQIKHSLIPSPSYTAGLVGRCSDIYSYYSSYIYTDNTNLTRLALRKNWKTGPLTTATVNLKAIIISVVIDPNIYYTLSMQVIGSNITVTLSGMPAIPSISLSYTDDGITYGPVLMGGYVGVRSDAQVSFHPYFDNFTYNSITSLPWLPLLLGN